MAGKLIFRTMDVEEMSPSVEEVLRKEINLPFPIPYSVDKADLSHVKVSSFGAAFAKHMGDYLVGDIAGRIVGAAIGGVVGDGVDKVLWKKGPTLGTITFAISRPRPVSLQAGIVRIRMYNYVVPLLFITPLSKSIHGKVELRKTGSGIYARGNFIGDAQAAAKLNAASDLVKRITKFTREKFNPPNMGEFIIEPFFTIIPQGHGSLLTSFTNVVPAGFTHGSRIDIQEFLALSSLIEALL
ncbi:MAG TPA: hypothetical protein VIZ18_12630 [Ktedonobacteraceae bacterium]